jgi:hypothetical protein
MRPIPAALAALTLALPIAVLPASAWALDMSGPLDAGSAYVWMNMGPVSDTIRQDMRNGKYGPAEQARQQTDDARAPAAQPITLRYTPSKERRARNLADFIAKSRKVDPEGADRLQKVFAQTDLIEAMRAPLGKAGLRIDDVADAYAAWWITAWYASRGSNETPSAGKVAAVKAQAARALSATPMMRGASDASRQQMAEALLIQAAMLDDAVEQSKARPDWMAGVRAAAAKGAKGMGLDLASMTLTDEGFVSV